MKYEFKVELKKTNLRKKKVELNKTSVSKKKKQLILAYQIVKYMDENNIKTLKEMSQVVDLPL